jgi:hypothetical protein
MATRHKKTIKKASLQAAPKAASKFLFGPPPLIQGEDPAAYEAFAAQVIAAVGPVDVLEEIWTRDFIDLSWEVQRLRRLRTKYLKSATHDATKEAIRFHAPLFGREDFLRGWERKDPEIMKEAALILKNADLDTEDLAAKAFGQRIAVFEKIDRLITTAEGRRNLALREIERRRDSLARRIQNAAPMIEDGEFRDVTGVPEK